MYIHNELNLKDYNNNFKLNSNKYFLFGILFMFFIIIENQLIYLQKKLIENIVD